MEGKMESMLTQLKHLRESNPILPKEEKEKYQRDIDQLTIFSSFFLETIASLGNQASAEPRS